MSIEPVSALRNDAIAAVRTQTLASRAPAFEPSAHEDPSELKAKFTEFVAGSFFKAMLEAMRKTVGNESVMHGGRAEEVFRTQLDDTLANRMAVHGGEGFSEKLFRQFLLGQGAKLDNNNEELAVERSGAAAGVAVGGVADHTW